MTENLDGACGEENIAEKFCVVYEELYNYSGSGVAMDDLKNQIEALVADDVDTLNEVMKVTGQVVKEAACKLKPAKSYVSEGYTSHFFPLFV